MAGPYKKDHYLKHLIPTHFYPRLEALSRDQSWHGWKGYYAPDYLDSVEFEYFAIRNATAVMDLSPMRKYRVKGKDAEAFFNRLITRDMTKLNEGRVGYSVWCNDRGKVVDDGTVFCLSKTDYRLCAYEHQLDWLMISAAGFDVEIADETEDVAALAVQGPTSFAVLKNLGIKGIEALKPFGILHDKFGGVDIMVSRTGFTGDLGYELWITPEKALFLWDGLFEAGKNHGIRGMGTHALEIARLEAGFLQAGCDFTPALHTVRKDHDRSPYELGLGWLVHLNKDNFTGRKALLEEKAKGSRYRFVKLDVEGNKPAIASYIFHDKTKKAGVVTSAAWSPTVKKNMAYASLEVSADHPLDDLWAEIYYQRELKWSRVWAKCDVVKKPFWSPERAKTTPPALV